MWRGGLGVVRGAQPRASQQVGGTRSGVPQGEGVLLADEGEVVVAAGGVRDRGAAIDRDAERGRVQAVAAVDNRIGKGIADTDGVTDVATAVDVADGDGATVGRDPPQLRPLPR